MPANKLRNFPFLLFLVTSLASLAVAGPHGLAPRASADRYHAHAQRDGISTGAELLTPKQVQKAFASDLNRCCVVVEVGFYPKKDEALTLSLDDFALFVEGSDVPIKPQDATVVAASLQKKASSSTNVAVDASVGVGYESGTYIDPVTGQKREGHGVYTETGRGVAAGKPAPAPGSTDRDREVMEKQLTEKALPEGMAVAPVAGYLYFAIPDRKKDTKYQLEYNLNGEKLILRLP